MRTRHEAHTYMRTRVSGDSGDAQVENMSKALEDELARAREQIEIWREDLEDCVETCEASRGQGDPLFMYEHAHTYSMYVEVA
jgi:hypothetical protein